MRGQWVRRTGAGAGRWVSITVLVCAPGWAGTAPAVTDAEIEARIEAMGRYDEVQSEPFSEEAFAEYLRGLVEDIPVEELNLNQVERIAPLYLYHPECRERMIVQLGALEREPGLGGARASVIRLILGVRDAPPGRAAEALGRTLSHKGIPRLVESGRGSDLFSLLRVLPAEALRPHAEKVAGLADGFSADMPARAWAASFDYLDVLDRIRELLPAGRADALRLRLAGQARQSADRAETEGDAVSSQWLRERAGPAPATGNEGLQAGPVVLQPSMGLGSRSIPAP